MILEYLYIKFQYGKFFFVDGKFGDEFLLQRGVRQGDALSATLFNIALQAVLEEIVPKGTIVDKTRQICAYADDIVIIARNEKTLGEVLREIKEKSKIIGLEINEKKTKYMLVSRSESSSNDNFAVADMELERVKTFIYLGSELNSKNKIGDEIQRRLMLGNRAYYANVKMLKSKLLTWTTKLKLYKTCIRPVCSL